MLDRATLNPIISTLNVYRLKVKIRVRVKIGNFHLTSGDCLSTFAIITQII